MSRTKDKWFNEWIERECPGRKWRLPGAVVEVFEVARWEKGD